MGLLICGCNVTSSETTTSTNGQSAQANGEGSEGGGTSNQKSKAADGKSGGENEGLGGYLATPEAIKIVKVSDSEVKVSGPAGTVVGSSTVSLGWISAEQYRSAVESSDMVKATLKIVATVSVDAKGGFQKTVSVEPGAITVSVGKATLGIREIEFVRNKEGQTGAVIDWDNSLANAGVNPWTGWSLGECNRSQLEYPSGDGGVSAPFVVCTGQQFAALMASSLAGDAYIELGADIDMDGIEYSPASTIGDSYSGWFDGRNHTISNLAIDAYGFEKAGMFVTVGAATIENLRVSVTIENCRSICGGIAGEMNYTTLSNVHVSANVATDLQQNSTEVGGVVGAASNIQLYEVTAEGVLGAGGKIGGIAGTANGVGGSSIGFDGEVNGNVHVGGLFGSFSPADPAFSDFYVYGTVNSSGDAGVIAGNLMNSSAIVLPGTCYLNAKIIATTDGKSHLIPENAGLTGACIAHADAGMDHSGDQSNLVIINASEAGDPNTFSDRAFDLENVWIFESGQAAPYLRPWAAR